MLNKIAIVGEAWGEAEALQRAPFVGPSGYLLTKMLEEAGIRRADCFLTNVFNFRPVNNDIETLCVSKTEDTSGLPALRSGKYLDRRYLPELARLRTELRDLSPNIVICAGGTATWAILGNTAISKLRGTVVSSTWLGGLKCLPVYHPAAILRDWSLRHVTVLDLRKAERESHYPEIRRPKRIIYIEPSLQDLEWYYENEIREATSLAVDIETRGRQITCIGFAPNPRSALVVPFDDPRRPNGCYWPDHSSERLAWEFVRRVLSGPQSKILQNALYDIHHLWRSYGLPTLGPIEDTMLIHHSLHPESEKGLGFLGSVYTNESSWKLQLRSRGKKETIKKED